LVDFPAEKVGWEKELIKAFHDAVDDYLALCEAEGKEPEKAYKGSFNIEINQN